jgi:nucleoside-diphosphate-sugar epimerase
VKKVLVLGGDEFIGGRVLLALANSDWAQPLADLEGARCVKHAHVGSLKFDATDPKSLSAALSQVEAVVNCLSGDPKIIAAAAQALFQCAPHCATPPLIVHISSMSVYGSMVGDIGEDAPLETHMENLGAYARAKIQAERVASGYKRKVILRPGCEYGPGGELWSGRVAKWLFAHRVGDLGVNGDGYCNLVYIDDLVDAVLRSLQKPAATDRVFNLSMPEQPTWNEYLVKYARALGAVPVKRISKRRLAIESKMLAAPLKALEIGTRIAGLRPFAPPAIPPSFLYLARQEIRLDSSQARRVLGWDCSSLDSGLATTAAWYAQGRSAGTAAGEPRTVGERK